LRQQFDLVRARRPAALREPFYERVGQRGCGLRGIGSWLELSRHAPEVARASIAAKRKMEQKGIAPACSAFSVYFPTDKRIFPADAKHLSLRHASPRFALPETRRSLLRARRFLYRPGAAGA